MNRFFQILFFFSVFLFYAAAVSVQGEDSRPDWPFPEGDFAPLFPFSIEKGAPDNITNVQTWEGPWRNAGEGDLLTVRDGRFMKGDTPFRFVGTNICFNANFCEHNDAERLALTLSRFGIRVVRLHHMDCYNIWGKNIDRTKTEIDPEQLEKLDYLIAQFRKRGICVNINLHVSRQLDERDGFEDPATRHGQDKGIDNFEPRMIEMQKKYARDLLTHVNPYTGIAYTDDPAVAMIEINNENSLVMSWAWDWIKDLGPTYHKVFQEKWNSWLKERYGTTETMKAALFPEGGIDPNISLESGTVPAPLQKTDPFFSTDEVKHEFVSFILDLEKRYWSEMYTYVKDELGAKQPVTGSQLQYGAWYNLAQTDYCDNHAYWQHPVFPNKQWDQNDWCVDNSAMVNSETGGCPASLSINRILGKAQTISEYDHAYPNLYGAEGNLILSAVAAYQGWSGINHFAWSHGTAFEPDTQTFFFDMCGTMSKQIHLPACYAMLDRGDVRSGPGKYISVQDLTSAEEHKIVYPFNEGWVSITNSLIQDKTLGMVCWTGFRLTDNGLNLPLPADTVNVSSWDELPPEFGNPKDGEIRNEFGQLRWNRKDPEAGFFTVDTEGVKVFTGFVRDRSFDYNALTITPGKTRLDWATISITPVRRPDFSADMTTLSPGRYLIAASGLIQNTDAKFKEYAPRKITCAAAYGGSMGHAPILCEGIPFKLDLNHLRAEQVTLYPLDGTGNRNGEIHAADTETGCTLELGPEYKTLWYELEVREK